MNSLQLELSQLQRPWLDAVTQQAVDWIANRSDPFTADDLREVVGSPLVANHLGVLLASLSTMGICEKCGWTESRRASRNGAVLRLWRRRL
jgi:hypothetical protein